MFTATVYGVVELWKTYFLLPKVWKAREQTGTLVGWGLQWSRLITFQFLAVLQSLEMLADVGTGWTEMRKNSWSRINNELLDGVMGYVGNARYFCFLC